MWNIHCSCGDQVRGFHSALNLKLEGYPNILSGLPDLGRVLYFGRRAKTFVGRISSLHTLTIVRNNVQCALELPSLRRDCATLLAAEYIPVCTNVGSLGQNSCTYAPDCRVLLACFSLLPKTLRYTPPPKPVYTYMLYTLPRQ